MLELRRSAVKHRPAYRIPLLIPWWTSVSSAEPESIITGKPGFHWRLENTVPSVLALNPWLRASDQVCPITRMNTKKAARNRNCEVRPKTGRFSRVWHV